MVRVFPVLQFRSRFGVLSVTINICCRQSVLRAFLDEQFDFVVSSKCAMCVPIHERATLSVGRLWSQLVQCLRSASE